MKVDKLAIHPNVQEKRHDYAANCIRNDGYCFRHPTEASNHLTTLPYVTFPLLTGQEIKL